MSALDSYSSGDGSCDTSGDRQGTHPTVLEIVSLVDNPDKRSSSASAFLNDSYKNFNCSVGVDSIPEVDEKRESATGRTPQLVNEDLFGVPRPDENICLEIPCFSGVQGSDALYGVLKDSVVEDGKINLVSHLSPDIEETGRILNENQNHLESKEKYPSAESIHVEEATGFGRSVELIKGDLFNGKDIPGVVEICPQVSDSVLKKGEYDNVPKFAPICSLNIQTIDVTTLFQSSSVSEIGNVIDKEGECVLPINDFNKNANADTRRKSRNKNKAALKKLEPHEMQHLSVPIIESSGSRRVYSRAHLEAWRFVDREGQRIFWNEVYSALGPVVTGEYIKLTRNTKHRTVNSVDPHQNSAKKEEASAILRDVIEVGVDGAEYGNVNAFDVEYGYPATSNQKNHGYSADEDAFIDDDDEEYNTILRPAFLVEGDPDFESGPPEDGLEYLRRVRWEAKQIPKVKVSKLEMNNIVIKEQTPYMPLMPDIALCSDHLLPSKTWEDKILVYFSHLRLALEEPHDDLDLGLRLGFMEFLNMESFELESALAMECAARASSLRKRIGALEMTGSDELVGVLALCAVVDVPLDADTCASLRCLLRKCAALRAQKSEPDDELRMLNVLITVSGKYFGQLGK